MFKLTFRVLMLAATATAGDASQNAKSHNEKGIKNISTEREVSNGPDFIENQSFGLVGGFTPKPLVERTTRSSPHGKAHGNFVPSVAKPAPVVTQRLNNIDCQNKSDGFYAKARCVREYNLCSSKRAYRYTCVNGLVFNEISKTCNNKDICLMAKPIEIATVASNLAPVVTGYSLPQSVRQVNNTFCIGKANGEYPLHKCSIHYVSCSDGIATRQICYYQLYFNSVNGQCDHQDSIEACTEIKKNLVPKGVSCTMKKDGIYSFGCHSYFYACIQQNVTNMHCGRGLFYNSATVKCDYKENVPECKVAAQD